MHRAPVTSAPVSVSYCWLCTKSKNCFFCFFTHCKGIVRYSLPFHYRDELGMERVPLGAHITAPPFSNWSLVWGATSHERLEYLSSTVSARMRIAPLSFYVSPSLTKPITFRNPLQGFSWDNSFSLPGRESNRRTPGPELTDSITEPTSHLLKN